MFIDCFLLTPPPVICQVQHERTNTPVFIARNDRAQAVGPTKRVTVYARIRSVGCKEYAVPPIKFMMLPKPGWWAVKGIRDSTKTYACTFTPTKGSDKAALTIAFYEDNKRPQLGRLFAKEPHELSPEEKAECLDADNAKLLARTVMWNHHKVLELEETGELRMQPIHTYELIYDSGNGSGDGNFSPASVRFFAIGDAYERYIGSVKEALKTIQWQ